MSTLFKFAIILGFLTSLLAILLSIFPADLSFFPKATLSGILDDITPLFNYAIYFISPIIDLQFFSDVVHVFITFLIIAVTLKFLMWLFETAKHV